MRKAVCVLPEDLRLVAAGKVGFEPRTRSFHIATIKCSECMLPMFVSGDDASHGEEDSKAYVW